jgi:RNA polymerase sigma-70 factor (ECF subfamily)
MNAWDPAAADASGDPPESAEIIVRAAAGDDGAFRELVRRHHARVYRWAVVGIEDRDDADDVAQTVWIRVHGALSSFHGGARFTTWLYSITRNAIIERNRLRDRRQALAAGERQNVLASEVPDAVTTIDAERLLDVVRGYLEQLPPRQREVFQLADLDGFAPAEVAELLNLEQVTVRTNLHKARRAIRNRMLNDNPKLIEEYRS